MSKDFRTEKDIRKYFISELTDIYPENEINSITDHIFKTQFGLDRLHLMTSNRNIITDDISEKIIKICDELKTGKPIQYILGETSFYNCTIKVNIDTLIPRPETEELVDLIIKENQGFKGRILDLGTGSGCIALALGKSFPSAKITGIDISERALGLARLNAALNKVNADFICGDIFNFDIHSIAGADIIVGNPPYVLESEKKNMHRNILGFEPSEALFVPDNDPLRFYSAITGIATRILTSGGKIYLEINETKGTQTADIIKNAGFKDVMTMNDLNGKSRFVKGVWYG